MNAIKINIPGSVFDGQVGIVVREYDQHLIVRLPDYIPTSPFLTSEATYDFYKSEVLPL